MKKLFSLTVLVAIVLLSCASSKSAFTKEEAFQTPLYGTKWSLKSIHTDTGKISVDSKAFLRFDSTKNSAGGNGSCNTFGSNVSIDGNSLSITNIFSTKMYCEGVQSIENAFLNHLAKATRYVVKENKLTLYAADTLLLELEA